jgi:hypothetical protein
MATRRPSGWRRSTIAVAPLAGVLLVGLLGGRSGAAGTQVEVAPFEATSSAVALRAKVTIPNFAVSDTPVDSGGPTAQSALDSLGRSQSYAAFPDPGQLVVNLPGLAAGLLSGGAAGLPPIQLPFPLPSYPLAVSTATPANPDQQVGAGPYEISGHNTSTRAEASATAGLQISALGNTGLLDASSSITIDDGVVTSSAVVDVQGVTIGPLEIGRLRSIARLVMDSSGVVAPTSSVRIDALRIGGVAVGLSPEGIDVAGVPVPLPIAGTLNDLLKGAGITLAVVPPPDTAEGTVATGGLEITLAGVAIPNVGTARVVLTLGSASASLRGATPAPAVSGGSGVGTTGGDGSGALPGDGSYPAPSGGAFTPPDLTSGSVAPTVLAPGSPAAAVRRGPPVLFDVESTYLVMAVAWAALLLFSSLIRYLGVRAPWTTSSVG